MLVRGGRGSSEPRTTRLAVVAVVLCATAVTQAGLLQAPTYEASAKVRAPSEAENGAIATRPVAEEVIRRWGLKITPAEFLDNLTVDGAQGRSVVHLTYEDTDNNRARVVVNTLAKVSTDASLVEPANVPVEPAGPHPWRNGMITLVVGLALIGVAKTVAIVRSARHRGT